MTENNDNELKNLIGKVLRIDTVGHDIPLYGRLLEVKPYWILIERKSGAKRMISRARITGIEIVGEEASSTDFRNFINGSQESLQSLS